MPSLDPLLRPVMTVSRPSRQGLWELLIWPAAWCVRRASVTLCRRFWRSAGIASLLGFSRSFGAVFAEWPGWRFAFGATNNPIENAKQGAEIFVAGGDLAESRDSICRTRSQLPASRLFSTSSSTCISPPQPWRRPSWNPTSSCPQAAKRFRAIAWTSDPWTPCPRRPMPPLFFLMNFNSVSMEFMVRTLAMTCPRRRFGSTPSFVKSWSCWVRPFLAFSVCTADQTGFTPQIGLPRVPSCMPLFLAGYLHPASKHIRPLFQLFHVVCNLCQSFLCFPEQSLARSARTIWRNACRSSFTAPSERCRRVSSLFSSLLLSLLPSPPLFSPLLPLFSLSSPSLLPLFSLPSPSLLPLFSFSSLLPGNLPSSPLFSSLLLSSPLFSSLLLSSPLFSSLLLSSPLFSSLPPCLSSPFFLFSHFSLGTFLHFLSLFSFFVQLAFFRKGTVATLQSGVGGLTHSLIWIDWSLRKTQRQPEKEKIEKRRPQFVGKAWLCDPSQRSPRWRTQEVGFNASQRK